MFVRIMVCLILCAYSDYCSFCGWVTMITISRVGVIASHHFLCVVSCPFASICALRQYCISCVRVSGTAATRMDHWDIHRPGRCCFILQNFRCLMHRLFHYVLVSRWYYVPCVLVFIIIVMQKMYSGNHWVSDYPFIVPSFFVLFCNMLTKIFFVWNFFVSCKFSQCCGTST